MNKTLSILIFVFLFSLLPPATVLAQEPSPGEEVASGAVVCAPDVYLADPGDCLRLGPSTYLIEMAKLGLTFPERALPASRPDAGLTQLPYLYFKLDDDIVPILSGPNGGETGQAFQPGFVYISYVDRVD